jgi:hypothetical protein
MVRNIMRRIRFACWITNATHTHTHTHRTFNTYRCSVATMVTRTRFGVYVIRTLPVLSLLPLLFLRLGTLRVTKITGDFVPRIRIESI